MNTTFGDKATWARATTQVPDTSKENPDHPSSVQSYQGQRSNVAGILFRVVRRVREDSGIKSPLNSIAAKNHNAVLPSLNELLIQKDPPLLMHEFTMAVGHELSTGSLSTCRLFDTEILEVAGKLMRVVSEGIKEPHKAKHTFSK
jgi:hypothetical protein